MKEESEHNVSGNWLFLRIAIVVSVLGTILFLVNIFVSSSDDNKIAEPTTPASGLTELQRDCINLNFAGVDMGFEPLTLEQCEAMFDYMYDSGWIPTEAPDFQSDPVSTLDAPLRE